MADLRDILTIRAWWRSPASAAARVHIGGEVRDAFDALAWEPTVTQRDSAPPRDDDREPSKSVVFGRTPTVGNGSDVR